MIREASEGCSENIREKPFRNTGTVKIRIDTMFKNSYFSFWRKYRFKSIAVKNSLKLFVIFLAFFTIPAFGIYTMTMNNTKKEALEINNETVKKIGATTEALIRDTEYLTAEIMADQDVENYMTRGENNPYTDEEKEEMMKKISTFMSGKTLIHSIYLYSEIQDVLCSDTDCEALEEFEDASWYSAYTEEFSDSYKMISRKIDNTANKVFTLIKKYRNNKGAVILNIDLLGLEKYISVNFNEDSAFYIAEPNNIMYTNLLTKNRNKDVEKQILKMIDDGKFEEIYKSGSQAMSISVEKSMYYNWYYIRTMLNNNYNAVVNGLFVKLILLFLGIMIVLIVMAVVLSMNSISQIINILDLFENRNAYKKLTENEISEVANKIIYLMDDNTKLKNEINSRNVQYEKWKMKALQIQITPHFLNNTLAVINYEVIETVENSENISKMISQLSKILTYSLVTDKIFVPLREELLFIKNYVNLLSLRYDNFRVDITADSSLSECMVLRMCLQPLIENSVFHGCKKDNGRISIKCEKPENDLIISVTDNGKGIEQSKIDQITESLKNDDMTDVSIGIKNIYKRLEAAFGQRAGIEIISKENLFTTIILTIPQENILFMPNNFGDETSD